MNTDQALRQWRVSYPARPHGATTYYLFRPETLLDARILNEWKAIHRHMQRTPGPKHLTLWCAIPPGSWDMKDVSTETVLRGGSFFA